LAASTPEQPRRLSASAVFVGILIATTSAIDISGGVMPSGHRGGTALPITSAGRFSPLGPRGNFPTYFLNAAFFADRANAHLAALDFRGKFVGCHRFAPLAQHLRKLLTFGAAAHSILSVHDTDGITEIAALDPGRALDFQSSESSAAGGAGVCRTDAAACQKKTPQWPLRGFLDSQRPDRGMGLRLPLTY
jgi:hypothetical protein